jgi:molybdenum cofactor cytidylyltransferase
MKFGPVPLEQAEGKILGHNIAGLDGRRILRKGKPVTAEDVMTLREIGRTTVYVAELEADDVDENRAAWRVAQAVVGDGLRLTGPATGRVNFFATGLGVFRVDAARLAQINACKGVTLATLRTSLPVGRKKGRQNHMVATVKILPYGVPESVVQTAESIAANTPIIQVDALRPRRAALILSGSPTAQKRIVQGFDPPLRARLEALGATVESVDFVPLEDEQGEVELAALLQRVTADLIVLAGETAVMDENDIAPRAIRRAGGEVIAFGAPVDPGNLLLLAQLNNTPILGAPGCARSPKVNIVDWVLPRLLVGDKLTHEDIFSLGHGGLLDEILERGLPRGKISSQ